VADEDGQAHITEAWRKGQFIAVPEGRREVGDLIKLVQTESPGSDQLGEEKEEFRNPKGPAFFQPGGGRKSQ